MNLTLCGRGEIKMMPHHIKYASGNRVKSVHRRTRFLPLPNLIMNFYCMAIDHGPFAAECARINHGSFSFMFGHAVFSVSEWLSCFQIVCRTLISYAQYVHGDGFGVSSVRCYQFTAQIRRNTSLKMDDHLER